jgi:hypothetical protein
MSTVYRELDRINDPEGLFYVSIETSDGLFRFVKHKQFTDTEYGQTYSIFTPIYWSGLYGSQADAERAALLELPWNANKNSN